MQLAIEVHLLLHFMHEYFANVIDVAGDGHCGFHVVSGLLRHSVEDHHIVRLELTIELNKNRTQYLAMFGSQQRFDQIKHVLTIVGFSLTSEDKWTMMPDMGFLLAQKYKHVVVLLSGNKRYSETFFPLEGASPKKERLMCLG